MPPPSGQGGGIVRRWPVDSLLPPVPPELRGGDALGRIQSQGALFDLVAEFFTQTATVQPLLLLLEDLHWGDLPTVAVLETLLRRHDDLPLMVLAIGREEIRELFPALWLSPAVTRIELTELSRRASEQLVREVLGELVDAETTARLAS